jgi:CDP-diglyceride synthetase
MHKQVFQVPQISTSVKWNTRRSPSTVTSLTGVLGSFPSQPHSNYVLCFTLHVTCLLRVKLSWWYDCSNYTNICTNYFFITYTRPRICMYFGHSCVLHILLNQMAALVFKSFSLVFLNWLYVFACLAFVILMCDVCAYVGIITAIIYENARNVTH